MAEVKPLMEWAQNWLKDTKSQYIGGQWKEGNGVSWSP